VAVVDRGWVRVLLSVFIIVGCGPSSDPAEDDVIGPTLPPEIADWSAPQESDFYDRESIFSYIDGHAEVYLAYGMKRCESRRYVARDGQGEIVLDLFEMASPADAFGVFSHDRAGETVEVGQGGVFRHGWLSFWSGSWYGSVYSTGGEDSSRRAVVDLGRAVAETLPGGGEVPDLVSTLPALGLDEATVCFLRSPQILNAHVFVGSDNPFGLGPDVEAVVGEYEIDGSAAHLVLVGYPSEATAQVVESRARASAGAESDRPAMVVGRQGALLAAVVGGDSGDLTESLLTQALGGSE